MQRSSAPVSNSSCSGFFYFSKFFEKLYSKIALRIPISIGTSQQIESSKRNLRFPFKKKTGESETIFAAFFSSPGAERQKGEQNAYIEKGQKLKIRYDAEWWFL